MFNLKIATVSTIITIHSILEVYSAQSGSFDIRSFLGKNVKGIRASGFNLCLNSLHFCYLCFIKKKVSIYVLLKTRLQLCFF